MEKYTEELYTDMLAQVQRIALTQDSELQKAEQAFHIVETTMMRLREYTVGYTFREEHDEIRFFKEIKPRFHCELVYFAELIHIETHKPYGSKELVISFYRQVLQRLQIYFERQQIHYLYYRARRTAEDKLLFLRDTACIPLFHDDCMDLDRQFSTVGGSYFAKFMGFEKMVNHLLHQIERLENGEAMPQPQRNHHTVWTDSKAALVELAYALYARGSLNHGQADIKDIVSDLEYLFHVHLGNFYRTYMDISIRKKSRTPFIDSMKESLERKMDEGLG